MLTFHDYSRSLFLAYQESFAFLSQDGQFTILLCRRTTAGPSFFVRKSLHPTTRMVFAGASEDTKAEEGETPLMLRFIEEHKDLKAFLRKVDNTFRVDSVSSFICGLDRSACGIEKCWDDENTMASAYTACTACTDYTGYYTVDTFRTEATGGTYDSRETYCTYGTYGTYATHGTYGTTTDLVESEVERREEAEENSDLSDSDESTVVAANRLAQKTEVGLSKIPIILPMAVKLDSKEESTVVAANQLTEKKDTAPSETPIIPPIAIEFDSKEPSIPWKDYSNPAPLLTQPPAIEMTEEDYYTTSSAQTTENRNGTSMMSKKVKNIFTFGLRKSSQASI